MRIARYWAIGRAEARQASGRLLPISCWRWSDASQAEAQQRADSAARDAAKRVETGQARREGYYLDRPPREEIVREITDDDGQTIATLTRNSYGSLILNTRDLMFIDVDAPWESLWSSMVRKVKRLFGRRADDPLTVLRERLARTANEHAAYTIRLYATFAGFRCAIVNRPVRPKSAECDELFSCFEADPLYARLCQHQECYRVRLTPKYWRCNASRPPHRYPWKDDQQEQQYRSWQDEYETQCEPYATCRFLEQFGHHPTDPRLRLLVELHDHVTRIDADPESVVLA